MDEKVRAVVERNLDVALKRAEDVQSKELEDEILDYLIYNKEDTREGKVRFIGEEDG